jgi:hypothetical protein
MHEVKRSNLSIGTEEKARVDSQNP